MLRIGVVIAAGGRGRRIGGGTPKQFLRLGDRTVLEKTVGVFQSHPAVSDIVIVVPRGFVRRTLAAVRTRRFSKVCAIVPGGRERQDSVREGLRALTNAPPIVLVHDAARPLITHKTITAVAGAARRYGAAVVGTPVGDTIKVEGRRGFFTSTLPRRELWAVQTPQGFRFQLLLKAHDAAKRAHFLGTDEAALVERLGVPVRIVRGTERNFKITTAHDLHIARSLVRPGRPGRRPRELF